MHKEQLYFAAGRFSNIEQNTLCIFGGFAYIQILLFVVYLIQKQGNSQRKDNGMKKTEYTMIAITNMSGLDITRRVWADENGNYFVKLNGEIRNVTKFKNDFIKD